MDAVQYEVGEGHCLDAIREPAAFQTDDLHQEDRRPSFSRRATDDTGVVSMLCYRLFIEGDTMGSTCTRSPRRGSTPEDYAVGSVFAAHAAVALLAANRQDHLKRPSRHVT